MTKAYSLQGVFATGWSRYASGRPQVDPIEGALDSLVYTARILHDGSPPEGGLTACIELLDAIGEGAAFRELQRHLEVFSAALDQLWDWVRQLEEQIDNLELEPHRAHSGIETIIHELLGQDLEKARKSGEAIEQLLRERLPMPLPRFFWQVRYDAVKRATDRVCRHPALFPSPVELTI